MEECIICFDETDQFEFLPCAHKLCIPCKGRLQQKRCPVCNTPFELDIQIQIQEPVQNRQTYNMKDVLCSRGVGLILLSFFGYIAYQSLNRTDF